MICTDDSAIFIKVVIGTKNALKIRVVTATGHPHTSIAKYEPARPELQGRIPVEERVMPTFALNLIGICQLCDSDCIVQ